MSIMQFQILGIGAWGPAFRNWQQLSAMLGGEILPDDGSKGPKPEVIPANERRRAPLPVRLAIESSWQAVQHAKLDPADVPSVFVSGIGDTQLTDYMCKVLAGTNKALSPTKFHNSVHNAASGYWTISTGCMQAASSIAGFKESVSLTLMESLLQCNAKQKPLLITFYDAPCSEVLKEMLVNDVALSISIVIAPKGSDNKKPTFTAEISNTVSAWPELLLTSELQHCYEKNQAAKVLAFLNLVTKADGKMTESVKMPLSQHTSLTISTP